MRPRTSGRDLPTLNAVFQGVVVKVQEYGAFVQVDGGEQFKDGFIHVSKISASGRIDKPSDVLAEGDTVWSKVCEVNEDTQKYSLDMRFIRQKNGEDLDPNGTQADSGSRGAKGGGKGPEPIRIGAVQATTCSRCGARGHMARECWGGGSQYGMVDEAPAGEAGAGMERGADVVPGVDQKIVRAAMEAYVNKTPIGMGDGLGTREHARQERKEEKQSRKERKRREKAEKKAKKQEKKRHKKEKKQQKKEKEETKEKERNERHGKRRRRRGARSRSDSHGGAPTQGRGKRRRHSADERKEQTDAPAAPPAAPAAPSVAEVAPQPVAAPKPMRPLPAGAEIGSVADALAGLSSSSSSSGSNSSSS